MVGFYFLSVALIKILSSIEFLIRFSSGNKCIDFTPPESVYFHCEKSGGVGCSACYVTPGHDLYIEQTTFIGFLYTF